MEALALELKAETNGSTNIKLTCIYPYAIGTGLFKKFTARFPQMMPILEPSVAAGQIIRAQRLGLLEMSIPRHLRHMNNFFRLFPAPAAEMVGKFLEAYVESDK
jgi:short-subunit dehydrogenase